MSRLITQIINKKLQLANECYLNGQYLRFISHFYGNYSICSALIKHQDEAKGKRNHSWRSYLKNHRTSSGKRILKQLMSFTDRDKGVIQKAINYLDLKREEDTEEMGNIYREFTVGCFAYEFPKGD